MAKVKFIHCSDLHLGRVFTGIASRNPHLAKQLQVASFNAFRNIINLAITEKVDFVLIAGDVFEEETPSLSVVHFLQNELQRLDENSIKSYIVCGNHDPFTTWPRQLSLPSSTTVFPAKAAKTVEVEQNNRVIATISGISFAEKQEPRNLASFLESPRHDIPSIALMHTDLGGDNDQNYAPCTLNDLKSTKFDYWALGHKHSFSILNTFSPTIVFAGCIQGSNPNETDEKGCCLVEIMPQTPPDIKFIATDAIRYKSVAIAVEECANLDDLKDKVHAKLLLEEKGSVDYIIARITLSGACQINHELRQIDSTDLLDFLQPPTDKIILDKLTLATRPVIDEATILKQNGFVAELLKNFTKLTPPTQASIFKELTTPLVNKYRNQLPLSDSEQAEIIDSAKLLLLDQLIGDQ